MRADIHDGQEHKRSVQGPDTEAQDLSPPNHHFPLATRGPGNQARGRLQVSLDLATVSLSIALVPSRRLQIAWVWFPGVRRPVRKIARSTTFRQKRRRGQIA